MRKGKRTSTYTAPNWNIFSCMYSYPCSLNGDQQAPFERTGCGCDSTAIYIQSVVPGHWTHWKTSLKEIPTVWAQGAGKKNRRCIVSKPSVLLLWKKPTEQRMLLSKPTDLHHKEKTSLPTSPQLHSPIDFFQKTRQRKVYHTMPKPSSLYSQFCWAYAQTATRTPASEMGHQQLKAILV